MRDEVENPRGQAGTLGNLGNLLGHFRDRREEARGYVTEAIELMESHGLDQAFGGRRLSDLRALRKSLGGEA